MKAQPHPRQDERLVLLRSYEILDTDPEKDFDDLVQLASQICDTSISVVNFIDEDRQWFKAETGLGVRETPLATSLCSHVILESEFVEIADTLQDPRMSDNPLCMGEPGLRFYAGALLTGEDGLPLGTLCVLDYAPKVLTPLQRDTLRVLARQVMAQLDMRKALRSNTLLRQEVDHRTKNSLQSLSALVSIQQRQAEQAETKRALGEVKARLEAVAFLHEQLYRGSGAHAVDLAEYGRALAANLSALLPENVMLKLVADPVELLPAQAVAVGTLINEFVANASKHGFPDGRAGRIDVSLDALEHGRKVRITCRDDGVGLPQDAEPGHGGLGMLIAQVVCAELEAELFIDASEGGPVLSLEFDVAELAG
ncbi:histidine kinase dimerization/phosphoacceptor domain -containing protein [Roseovarius aquimarinus]|uniref:Histidine kinase dimerization/phosphoacceptor domain -containing protein n=1 Tax=Roseovarius aquimarinus TaxID=1229156 RepID=A0ABW7I7X7_9RHOB